jgi:O-antigen/teichoic acid export membrane protein
MRLRQRSFAAAVAATYGANVGAALLSLANVIVTARALGPVGRGDLAFLTTIAMLSATLATLGIEEASANLAGTEPENRRALATNSLVLALLQGGLAIVLLLSLILVFPGIVGDASAHLLWLAFAAIPVLVLQAVFLFLIRADYGFAVTNAAALVSPLLTLTVNGALAASGRITVGTALLVWVLAQLLVTLLLVWYVANRLQGFGRPETHLARRALGFGLKAHTGRIMKTGNYRFDQWLLGALAGPRELGLYSVAVALLCITVFGSEFAGSVADLRMLAPGAFGIVALKLFANALTAQNKPMLGNAAVGIAFATSVGLGLVLIPRYGGFGAAVAATAAYTAGGTAVAVIFTRSLRGNIVDLVPRPADVQRLVTRLRTGTA